MLFQVSNRWKDGLLRRHKLVLDWVPNQQRRCRQDARRAEEHRPEDITCLGIQRRHIDPGARHRVVSKARGRGVYDQHGR